jgi:succinate-acetate transporter protein
LGTSISALRRNLGFVILLSLLDITFLLLAIGNYMGENATIIKAGGGFGIVTAFVAYYCAAAEILRPDDSLFTLPLGNLRKRVD